MAQNFFQDMVRIKKAGDFRPKDSTAGSPTPRPVPPPPPPLPPTIPDRVPQNVVTPPPAPSLPKTPSPKPDTEFASVYDLSDRGSSGGHKTSRGLWFLAGICVLVLLFSLSLLFSEAKVTINPHIEEVALNKNFFATKGALSSDLVFDLIVVSGESKKKVAGGEERVVNDNATGKAVIYNTYSSAVQRLDINTRLEGSNGKIYKTEKQITVPGVKSDGTPGSVEVGIYATEPGEAYNSAPLDFTIVGFKGTPKYSKFYARSKGEISGGRSGTAIAISPTEEAVALEEIKSSLKTDLMQKAQGSIPPGFVLFDGATSLVIDKEGVEALPEESGMAEIKVQGSLYGFLFDSEELARKIAETSLENFDGHDVMISGLSGLEMSIYDQDALSFKDTKNMTFNLSGDVEVVWKLDEEKIISDLLGRPKKDLNQILSLFPNVVSGKVTLRPFWRRTLPEELKDIKLIVNYPQ